MCMIEIVNATGTGAARDGTVDCEGEDSEYTDRDAMRREADRGL